MMKGIVEYYTEFQGTVYGVILYKMIKIYSLAEWLEVALDSALQSVIYTVRDTKNRVISS